MQAILNSRMFTVCLSSMAASSVMTAFAEFSKYSSNKMIQEMDDETLKNIKKFGTGKEFDDYLCGNENRRQELLMKYYYDAPSAKEVMEQYNNVCNWRK